MNIIKNKNLFKYNFKELLPISLISSIFIFVIFIIYVLSMDVSIYKYSNEDFRYPEFEISYLMIPIIIFTFILPLYINNYRYKKELLDTYLSLPINKNEYRINRSLVGLIYILISFTLPYIISILILFIRQATFISNEGSNYIKYFFNYIPFLYIYFIILFFIISNYLISLGIVSLYDNLIDSILSLILFNFISFYLFFSFENIYAYLNKDVYIENMSYYPSIFSYISIISSLLISLLNNKSPSVFLKMNNINLSFFIVGLILYLTILILSILYFYFKKENSAEYVLLPGGRNKFGSIFIHLSAFLLSYNLFEVFNVKYFEIIFLIFYVIYVLLYYSFLVILNRKFKIRKIDLYLFIFIIIFSVISSSLLSISEFYLD